MNDPNDPHPITKERALEIIGPDRLALVRDCHPQGWKQWVAIRATGAGANISPTTRAGIVHDGTVAYARSVFPDVMCGSTHGLFTLDMDGRATVRFKLLDDDLAPSGIPTGQAVLFEDQAQLDGAQSTVWPRVPMLIAGYTLDALGTTIDKLVLVLRRRGEVLWQHDLRAPIVSIATPGARPSTAVVSSTRGTAEADKETGEETQ